MGWWGHGIMDGDTPLDAELLLEDIVGGEPNAQNLYAHEAKIIEALASITDDNRRHVYWQAYGYTLMNLGAPMSSGVCNAICLSCSLDEWANEGDELRMEKVNRLHRLALAYKGEAFTIAELEGKGD